MSVADNLDEAQGKASVIAASVTAAIIENARRRCAIHI